MYKILLSLALSLVLCLPVSAQVSVDNFYEVTDFSKMLQSHISPFLIPKGGAAQAFNVRANETFGALAKREKMLLLSTCRAAPVKSLHRYYKSDDTKYTLQTSSTFLDSVDDSTGDCTALYSGLTDGAKWNWVTYKDIAIGMNGADAAVKYDGHTLTTTNTDAARTAGDLVAELGAPFAELNTGANLDASSWYVYKFAYYDGSNYFYSNARSNPILTGSSVRDVFLTDVPIGPSGTTTRYVFRSDGAASRAAAIALANSSYKLAITIANNTATTQADAIADGSLTTVYSTWISSNSAINVTPPKAELSVIHKDRLFIGNDPSGTESGKSAVNWSAVFRPDYFDISNDYELIRPDDGDEITCLRNILGILTICKTNTIQKIYTDTASDANWTVSAPFSFIGNVAPYSTANVLNGIAYRGRYGIYTFDGQQSELISDVVTDAAKDMLETNFPEMEGIFNNNQYLLAYTSKETGAANNDRVLILDMVRNAYVIDTKEIDSFANFNSGSDFGTLYSGSSGTDGSVYAHSGAFNQLLYRYQSQLEEGTMDSVGILGTETDPYLELAWGVTINDASLSAYTINNYSPATAIIDRPATTGYWYSPIVQIDAQNLDKIFWNEDLNSVGNVTWAVRSGASSAATASASFSSELSDPSGSDLSGLTANVWVQLRATLTTSDITITPQVFLRDSFVAKMTYSKEGSGGESSILSIWQGGYTNFDTGNNPKRIKEIQVFYEGTAGTIAFQYENIEKNINSSFNIDLSINPTASSTDQYFGDAMDKVFVHIPNPISESPVGRYWRLSVTESGAVAWKINKIVVRYDVNGYTTFK